MVINVDPRFLYVGNGFDSSPLSWLCEDQLARSGQLGGKDVKTPRDGGGGGNPTIYEGDVTQFHQQSSYWPTAEFRPS